MKENKFLWVIYFLNRKELFLKEIGNKIDVFLKMILRNNSNIDVIIFKVGFVIGWDIFRVCMLV